jgi:hypothetical protein
MMMELGNARARGRAQSSFEERYRAGVESDVASGIRERAMMHADEFARRDRARASYGGSLRERAEDYAEEFARRDRARAGAGAALRGRAEEYADEFARRDRARASYGDSLRERAMGWADEFSRRERAAPYSRVTGTMPGGFGPASGEMYDAPIGPPLPPGYTAPLSRMSQAWNWMNSGSGRFNPRVGRGIMFGMIAADRAANAMRENQQYQTDMMLAGNDQEKQLAVTLQYREHLIQSSLSSGRSWDNWQIPAGPSCRGCERFKPAPPKAMPPPIGWRRVVRLIG